MWKPIYQPEPWQQFVKRKDIKGLPLMEQRKKYMQEQLLFENYLSTLNTVNTVSTVAAGAVGGPTSGGGRRSFPEIIFKIDTRYQAPPEEWNNNNPTTKIWMWLERYNPEFFKVSSTFMYNSAFYITYYRNDGTDIVGPRAPMTIDWGDGNVEEVVTYNTINDTTFSSFGNPVCAQTHSYAQDGEYTIKITGESAYDIQFAFLPLVDIIKYDPTLQSTYTRDKTEDVNADALFFCTQWSGWDGTQSNMRSWDTSNWTRLFGTFGQQTALGWTSSIVPSEIEGWDVSNVNTIDSAFASAGSPSTTLNLGNWDLSSVGSATSLFRDANFVSGARYDLWEYFWDKNDTPIGWSMFTNAFRETPGRGGGLPPLGSWEIGNSIPDGATNVFSSFGQYSGISDEMWGEAFTSWASQSSCPINIAIEGQVGGSNRRPWRANYWEASGSFKTGGDENLLHIDTIEASASFSVLTSAVENGGKGWTIPSVVVLV